MRQEPPSPSRLVATARSWSGPRIAHARPRSTARATDAHRRTRPAAPANHSADPALLNHTPGPPHGPDPPGPARSHTARPPFTQLGRTHTARIHPDRPAPARPSPPSHGSAALTRPGPPSAGQASLRRAHKAPTSHYRPRVLGRRGETAGAKHRGSKGSYGWPMRFTGATQPIPVGGNGLV